MLKHFHVSFDMVTSATEARAAACSVSHRNRSSSHAEAPCASSAPRCSGCCRLNPAGHSTALRSVGLDYLLTHFTVFIEELSKGLRKYPRINDANRNPDVYGTIYKEKQTTESKQMRMAVTGDDRWEEMCI